MSEQSKICNNDQVELLNVNKADLGVKADALVPGARQPVREPEASTAVLNSTPRSVGVEPSTVSTPPWSPKQDMTRGEAKIMLDEIRQLRNANTIDEAEYKRRKQMLKDCV